MARSIGKGPFIHPRVLVSGKKSLLNTNVCKFLQFPEAQPYAPLNSTHHKNKSVLKKHRIQRTQGFFRKVVPSVCPRSSMIHPGMIGLPVTICNGLKKNPFTLMDTMVGHRAGEYVGGRKKANHFKKKK